MKEKKRTFSDPMDYDFITSSATDCTGLIPAAPENEEEVENYEELYPFLPPVTSSVKKQEK